MYICTLYFLVIVILMICRYNRKKVLCNYVYVFVSCDKYSNRWDRIRSTMQSIGGEYIIVRGGNSAMNTRKEDVVTMACDDSYAGLPEKILCACRYVTEHYPGYGMIKVDDDIELYQRLETHVSMGDYCGWRIHSTPPNPKGHIGRVPTSVWNNIEFNHEDWTKCNKLPYKYRYADGGAVYSLSNRSLKFITNFKTDPKKSIYEDVMIGGILASGRISPTHIHGLNVYGGKGFGKGYYSKILTDQIVLYYKNKPILQLDDSTH